MDSGRTSSCASRITGSGFMQSCRAGGAAKRAPLESPETKKVVGPQLSEAE